MNDNSDSPKKLYEIIIDSILKKIDQNQFSFETPICTEIQLMEEFQVSISAIDVGSPYKFEMVSHCVA